MRGQRDELQDLCRSLFRGDALCANFLRQLGFGDRDAVLDEHRRDVHVGAELKGHGQVVRAVVGAVGRHVEHAFDAVDLLLDRSGNRLGDGLCIGTGIGRGRPCTVGGEISGNLATGNVPKETIPAIMMMIEITDAKIGR